MSRIGKKPIPVPAGVNVSVQGNTVLVESGKNKLSFAHRPEVGVAFDAAAKTITVTRKDDSKPSRALHGTTRALIQNLIVGVTTGYAIDLELNGVGWTAVVQGNKVVLTVGFADKKIVEIPAGVTVTIVTNKIKVSGTDKQKVGQTAAEIRKQRKPEPYNGKGIKYADEVIVRKQGKAFASGG
jgi:large subunit ribosomal protein L6